MINKKLGVQNSANSQSWKLSMGINGNLLLFIYEQEIKKTEGRPFTENLNKVEENLFYHNLG